MSTHSTNVKKTIHITGIIVIVTIALAGLLIVIGESMNPFTFNQYIIQKTEIQYGNGNEEIVPDYLHSSILNGYNTILGNPQRTPPAFDDSRAFFDYVYSWIPPHAIVYPTEGFYYYQTILPDKGSVWGNMRIADLDNGILSIAYFTVPMKETHYLKLTEKDGLVINKISNYAYDVTYRGKTIHFKLPTTDFTPPQQIELLPMEEFVGHIHDESDTKLFLIYNYESDSFYLLLDEERGTSDPLIELNQSIRVGTRTNFAYYYDQPTNRSYLLGVYLPNVEANNFFDGPGDQVPFRPNIKKKINEAYPNTLLEDGIDDHGVYLNKDQWVRIAISPYDRYTYTDQLFTKIASCQPEEEASLYWTCLTKEWWNNRYWREDMYRQIIEEGKPITIPEWEEFTIDMNTMNIKNLGDWDGNSI